MMVGKFREMPSPADRAASAPFMIISVVATRGMDPVSKVWPIEVLNEGSLRPPHAVVIAEVPWHADDISPSFLSFPCTSSFSHLVSCYKDRNHRIRAMWPPAASYTCNSLLLRSPFWVLKVKTVPCEL